MVMEYMAFLRLRNPLVELESPQISPVFTDEPICGNRWNLWIQKLL
jgi:hypothetical protein